MTMPAYQREGWRPHGPGLCLCPTCRKPISTNALARASHARKHVREQAELLELERARNADHVDGFDRDDLGESPDY